MKKVLRVYLAHGHRVDILCDSLDKAKEQQGAIWSHLEKSWKDNPDGKQVMMNFDNGISFWSSCLIGFYIFDHEPDKYYQYLDRQMSLQEEQRKLLPKQDRFVDNMNEAMDPDAKEPWRQKGEDE